MAARPLKRKLSSRQLTASANQVDAAIEKQERARSQKEEHRMLAEITGELQQCPEKIVKAYMLVVETDACLPKKEGGAGSTLEFSEHYQTLSRLPLGYLRTTFLPTFIPALLAGDEMTKLLAQDPEVDFKIMMALLVVGRNHAFGPKREPEFVAAYRRRHEMHGHPCAKLSWGTDHIINWNKEGLYKLLPVKPKRLLPNDYAKHSYSAVTIGNGKIKASLGKYGAIVDASWEIQKNWDFAEASLVDENGDYPVKLASFFAGNEAFQAYVAPEFSMVVANSDAGSGSTPKGKPGKQARQMVRRGTPVALTELFKDDAEAPDGPQQPPAEEVTIEGQDAVDAAADVLQNLNAPQ